MTQQSKVYLVTVYVLARSSYDHVLVNVKAGSPENAERAAIRIAQAEGLTTLSAQAEEQETGGLNYAA